MPVISLALQLTHMKVDFLIRHMGIHLTRRHSMCVVGLFVCCTFSFVANKPMYCASRLFSALTQSGTAMHVVAHGLE